MNKLLRMILAGAAALAVGTSALTVSASGTAGRWIKNDHGWWYSYAEGGYAKDGWEKIQETWYYFTGDGYMKTGWLQLNGRWYFLDGSGAMRTGWVQNAGKWYFMQANGAMKTGWLSDRGKWYFLDGSGAMLRHTSAVIGGKSYWFDASGAMLEAEENLSDAGPLRFAKENIELKDGDYTCFLSDFLSRERLERGCKIEYISENRNIVQAGANSQLWPVRLGTAKVKAVATSPSGKVSTAFVTVHVTGKPPRYLPPEDCGAPHCTPQGVLDQINAYRAEHSLPPLSYYAEWQAQADLRARESAEKFSHTRPDGSGFYTAFPWNGYLTECLARTADNVDAFLAGWIYSPAHNAILLDPEITSAAVGIYRIDYYNTYISFNGSSCKPVDREGGEVV